uniref:Reverse transcriptase domain-containing protein n=1 Tax=Tanacetum cinerariifolium TaxID=118510 RepID=A0A6L2J7T9_TANCI|nr:reverse transcriptase domain-containing protein [Tanacetum cinerariifolium]
MPSHIKTYDGSEDPEDHLKIFQVAAKTERWAMPTWCHMFNSTLTRNARVWFDDLSPESIDSYDDLKKAFLEKYLQQKKYIKDPIELHNIKQRDGESTKDFVRRYKLESRDVNGAPKCMRIFGFVHGETSVKDKALAILMVQSWERAARQKIPQSFSPNTEILFPLLNEEEGTKGLMIIEAEIGGHCIHRMYVDGGSASEILYEHCFNRLRSEIKNQLVPATTPLIRFSGEIIWPIGQIQLLESGNASSSVSGSWNAKNLGGRRNNYPKEQQVGSVGMHAEEEMFLGYKVNTKGLKVCPDKKGNFHWTTEAEEAFKQMKQLIAELPMLTVLMEKEKLIVYLAATKETVSAVPMTEKEAKQMPIYFVSRALRGPELNYTLMEKLILALVHTSKRLKRYFQAHPIIVITDQPIQQGGIHLRSEIQDATYNEAEYEALIAELRIVEQMGVKNLQENVDSRLVAIK